MVTQRIVVPAHEVVFVKGVLEASEGVAAVFAVRGGELSIATPASRAAELSSILHDLARDGVSIAEGPALEGPVDENPPHDAASHVGVPLTSAHGV